MTSEYPMPKVLTILLAMAFCSPAFAIPNQFTNSFDPPPKDGEPFLLTWDSSSGGSVIIVDNWLAISGIGSNNAFERTVYWPNTGSYLWNVPASDVHGPHYLTIGTMFGVIDEASPFWTVPEADVATPTTIPLSSMYTDTLATAAVMVTGTSRPPIVYNSAFYSNSFGQDLQCTDSISSSLVTIPTTAGYPATAVMQVNCAPAATPAPHVGLAVAKRAPDDASAPQTGLISGTCYSSGYVTHSVYDTTTVCCPSYWSVYRFNLISTVYCASTPGSRAASSSYNPSESAIDLYFVTITPAGLLVPAAQTASTTSSSQARTSATTIARTSQAAAGIYPYNYYGGVSTTSRSSSASNSRSSSARPIATQASPVAQVTSSVSVSASTSASASTSGSPSAAVKTSKAEISRVCRAFGLCAVSFLISWLCV